MRGGDPLPPRQLGKLPMRMGMVVPGAETKQLPQITDIQLKHTRTYTRYRLTGAPAAPEREHDWLQLPPARMVQLGLVVAIMVKTMMRHPLPTRENAQAQNSPLSERGEKSGRDPQIRQTNPPPNRLGRGRANPKARGPGRLSQSARST